MTPLLSIDRLNVNYDGTTPALEEIALTIAPGERIGVIGESGSGKSTLALAIAGLLPRTASVSGSVLWRQTDMVPRNGTDIGYVFQDPSGSFDPVMRVGTHLAEVVRVLRKASRSDAHHMAVDLLSRVGFPDANQIAVRFPHQLSGGQKQRVAIACALAGRPKLLIADEATSALDTIVQAGIVRLLNQLIEVDGLSLLFITHDLPLASTLADRLVVLRNGHVVETGTPRAIIDAPQHPYVAKLVASQISLDGPTLLEQLP